jgi:hypothetical protein
MRRKSIKRRASIDPSRLVFLDESGAKTNMTRFRGRAPRGERLVANCPHSHWKTTTMIIAVIVTVVSMASGAFARFYQRGEKLKERALRQKADV